MASPAVMPTHSEATEDGSAVTENQGTNPPLIQGYPGLNTGIKSGWTAKDGLIGEIQVNMLPEEVLGILGEPEKKEQHIESYPEFGYGIYSETWSYPGLEVKLMDFASTDEENHLWKPVVWSIEVTGGSYATYRGVMVGDPEEKVTEAYGAPPYVYGPNTTDADPTMDIFVENGVVTKLYIQANWGE
jgi:hypothetical protein